MTITTKTRKAWRQLTAERKQRVAEGYKRHLRACKKAGIGPDASWLSETIADCKRGIYGELDAETLH